MTGPAHRSQVPTTTTALLALAALGALAALALLLYAVDIAFGFRSAAVAATVLACITGLGYTLVKLHEVRRQARYHREHQDFLYSWHQPH